MRKEPFNKVLYYSKNVAVINEVKHMLRTANISFDTIKDPTSPTLWIYVRTNDLDAAKQAITTAVDEYQSKPVPTVTAPTEQFRTMLLKLMSDYCVHIKRDPSHAHDPALNDFENAVVDAASRILLGGK